MAGKKKPDWTGAACQEPGVDVSLFFPGRGEQLEEAKSYCRRCPVRIECLEFGLNEKWGVWGGLSDRERRKERRRRRLALGEVPRPARPSANPDVPLF